MERNKLYWLTIAAPEDGFLRDQEVHPQSLGKARLHLYPGPTAREGTTLDEIFRVVEADLGLGATVK